MTSQVKWWVLLSLLNISVVGPKVPSSLKTTKHENFSFWYHKQNPHTEINQLPVTTKILSQPGIQLCVAFVGVQLWQTDWHGLHESLPWLVQHSGLIWTKSIHLICQIFKKIFQLHYGTVNLSPSQQMYKCLAAGATALCVRALQQCGCKITHREQKWYSWWLLYTLIKTANKAEGMFCNTWHEGMIPHLAL
jgi:hypothetical protein